MILTEATVLSLYDKSLAEAVETLSFLSVAEGRKPSLRGLNGWVFEQTIRYCLSRELHSLGFSSTMSDQEPLCGRARIDLSVGKAAIELKVGGSFGVGDSKYVRYRKAVEDRGQTYLYLSRQENHRPYREASQATFGSDHSFFLDTMGDWVRFVQVVASLQ